MALVKLEISLDFNKYRDIENNHIKTKDNKNICPVCNKEIKCGEVHTDNKFNINSTTCNILYC